MNGKNELNALNFLEEFPDEMTKKSNAPAAAHLFNVDQEKKQLPEAESQSGRHGGHGG